MTSTPDVIRLVRELQSQLPSTAAFNVTSDSFGVADAVGRLAAGFPQIASALLIAWDALEEIKIGSLTKGKWTAMDKTTTREVVEEALSQIRSL